MNNQQTEQLAVMIQATSSAITSKSLSDDVLELFIDDLSGYSLDQIKSALRRCRLECSFFNLKEVVSRIDDGRPEPEEAWGMIPKDEAGSIVWTTEMQEAYGAAIPLIDGGDRIGARMAFLEKYRVLVASNRARCLAVKWQASLGHDQQGRERALKEAVEQNRLTRDHAIELLPSGTYKVKEGGHKLLEAVSSGAIERAATPEQLAELREELFPARKSAWSDALPNKRPTDEDIKQLSSDAAQG